MAAKNKPASASAAISNPDVDDAEQVPAPTAPTVDRNSWAQLDGPASQTGFPATLTKEQEAVLNLREAANDAEREAFMSDALNQGTFLNGQRQLLTDPLARLLNCTSYISKPEKPWSVDYKGRPTTVVFDREYPQKRVMVDNFGYMPEQAVLDERRRLCAQYGYLYAAETPARVLNGTSLTAQFEESRAVMAAIVDKAKK